MNDIKLAEIKEITGKMVCTPGLTNTMHDYADRVRALCDEIEAAAFAIKARLTEAERLLARIDNADAIGIDREYPAADVAEADRIYDDLHAFLMRTADSASAPKGKK